MNKNSNQFKLHKESFSRDILQFKQTYFLSSIVLFIPSLEEQHDYFLYRLTSKCFFHVDILGVKENKVTFLEKYRSNFNRNPTEF